MKQKKADNKEYVKSAFLYTVAFCTGTSVMILEMLGFRLLAPYFGYSTYIWGSLIGIIMAALSAGYLIGGNLADRYQKPSLLFLMIFLSGLYTGIMTWAYKSILLFSQNFGLIGGSIVATVILFACPMVLLSAVSPFIIRVLAEEKKMGSIAGKIYSISTMGSIAGTFLSSFYLIPVLGSHKTLVICAIFLIVSGITGLTLYKKEYAFLILVPLLFNYPEPSPGENIIFSKESPYSHVEVEKYKGWLLLKPEANFIHSIYKPDRIMTDNLWDYYCIAPLICKKPEKCLILGMGGGTSVRQYLYFWPDMKIDALDIDPVIVDVAKNLFGVPANNPNLNIIIEDARTYLENIQNKYDFIQIDIFRGGVYIPFYLASKEFFSLCYKRLETGGMVIMNVNILKDASEKEPSLYGCTGNTISEIFPSVFSIKLDSGNALFLAFRDKIKEEDLLNNFKDVKSNREELQKLFSSVYLNIKSYKKDSNSFILTDDLAPLDELTYPIAVHAFKKINEW